jgi:hypothetical protein
MDSSFCSVFSFCVSHSCGCHIILFLFRRVEQHQLSQISCVPSSCFRFVSSAQHQSQDWWQIPVIVQLSKPWKLNVGSLSTAKRWVLWRVTSWTGSWSCKLLTFPAATYFLLHTHCTCFAHVLCRTDWVHFARCLSESISICWKLWAVKSMSYPLECWISFSLILNQLRKNAVIRAHHWQHSLSKSWPTKFDSTPSLSLSLSLSLCLTEQTFVSSI